MSNSKSGLKEGKKLPITDILKRYERKTDPRLWVKIQKNARGNETQKCEAAREILTNFYKTPKEADELVKQLATENSAVRVEIAKLLESGKKNFSYGLFSELKGILRKDDNPFVKKILEEEDKRQLNLLKPVMTHVMDFNKMITDVVNSTFKRVASFNTEIMKATLNIPRIERTVPLEALPRIGWQQEREKLLNYITVLEKQLVKEKKEKEYLLKVIKESKKKLKKKANYIS